MREKHLVATVYITVSAVQKTAGSVFSLSLRVLCLLRGVSPEVPLYLFIYRSVTLTTSSLTGTAFFPVGKNYIYIYDSIS